MIKTGQPPLIIVHSRGKKYIKLLYFRYTSQKTQNICITILQFWSNVENVGPTMYKCYTNILCSLGYIELCNIKGHFIYQTI